jgi:dihydropyrimidine dehydrogenase (NAD+) subunit PreA
MTIEHMGSDVGTNLELLESFSRAAKMGSKLPFIAKMTPNLTTMETSARAAIKGGADGISAINTIKSITNIDHENMTGMPVVNGKSSVSGYSGAACRPIALRFAAQCLQDEIVSKHEFSGIGGIETWHDALDFLLIGCRNIQVTTGIMQYGYRIVEDMASGLSFWMEEHGYNKLDDFIGKALPNIIPAENLDRDFKIQVKFDEDKCVGCGRCYVSCYDAAHQAIEWDEENRKPSLIKDNCVGCHLCLNVCPVQDCITPGEIVWKDGKKPHDVTLKHNYE